MEPEQEVVIAMTKRMVTKRRGRRLLRGMMGGRKKGGAVRRGLKRE